MSNEFYIDKYKKEVKLIESILSIVNVTQAERVKRIYDFAFVQHVYSDQDFFEAINWYAKKCIRIAAERSLRASKKYDVIKVRFWNSCIIVLTPLLGDHPLFGTETMINELVQYDLP